MTSGEFDGILHPIVSHPVGYRMGRGRQIDSSITHPMDTIRRWIAHHRDDHSGRSAIVQYAYEAHALAWRRGIAIISATRIGSGTGYGVTTDSSPTCTPSDVLDPLC
jgi:hypothetical protein